MGPECHYHVVHFSVSQHTGWMAQPNEQWQKNILIFTVYSIASLLHLSKEKQRVVWAVRALQGCGHAVPGMALLSSPTFYLICSSGSPPCPRVSSSLTHWWWVDVWLSAYCHAWRLLEEQRKEKEHQDRHFHWDHEHMNCAETMFHCYFGGHRIKHTKFCSSNWSPCTLFYSSGKGARADSHIREGKQLDNWMAIRCGIPGMLQRALWVQSCECHKCYHKWFTDTHPNLSKTISPQRLVTHFLATAMLGKRVLLEGCTSLGRSDIFLNEIFRGP